jgi:hypothetical protein
MTPLPSLATAKRFEAAGVEGVVAVAVGVEQVFAVAVLSTPS